MNSALIISSDHIPDNGITPPHLLKPRVLYSVLLHCLDSLSPTLFTCYVAIGTPTSKPIGQPEEVAAGEGVQVRGFKEGGRKKFTERGGAD